MRVACARRPAVLLRAGRRRHLRPEPGAGARRTRPVARAHALPRAVRSAAGPPRRGGTWMDGFAEEELAGSIRTPVPAVEPDRQTRAPGVDPLGRPRARDERGRPSRPPAEGQRLVVTVHDLAFDRYPGLFPRAWRSDVPARAARGRPARGRDRDAVAHHRRGRPVADEGRPAQAPRGPRGRRVAAERRRRGRDALASQGPPAVRPVRRHDRTEEEPGSAGPGVPARGRDRRAARARAGRSARLAPREPDARARARGPGRDRDDRRRSRPAELDAVYRAARGVRLPVGLRGVRPPGARGDEPRDPRRGLEPRPRSPRSRATRRSASTRVRCARSPPRSHRWSATSPSPNAWPRPGAGRPNASRGTRPRG